MANYMNSLTHLTEKVRNNFLRNCWMILWSSYLFHCFYLSVFQSLRKGQNQTQYLLCLYLQALRILCSNEAVELTNFRMILAFYTSLPDYHRYYHFLKQLSYLLTVLKAYPDLASLPEKPDVVLLFRRSTAVPPFVDQAIEIGAKVVWMQLGIINVPAADNARAAGLDVVMDACMMVEHRRCQAYLV